VSPSDLILAGVPVVFPDVAKKADIDSAAKHFAKAWGVPPEAASALAAALVDPGAEKVAVDAGDPNDHLQSIETPSGRFLLCHRARVWSCRVSADGGNGRSRYALQTKPGGGGTRPWPIGEHIGPAVVEYMPDQVGDMVVAVQESAKVIRSPELLIQIGRNPRGIWNPPVIVLAKAVSGGDERWFLHTIEGSTRVEACHELTYVAPGAPLDRAAAPLDHLREVHEQLLDLFNEKPASARSLAAARAAAMPALIVVAAIEENQTPIASGFPALVNDYVESVHVQPRPFDDLAQSNVLGERLLLTLLERGALAAEEAAALLGRGPTAVGKASVRAARLVQLVCDPQNDGVVRDLAVTEDGRRLTRGRRAALIGPLVVRQFAAPAETADRALIRPFTPDRLTESWTLSEVSAAELRSACIDAHEKGESSSDHIAELMARGGPALCAAGVLLSDQGSTVKGISELRGSVDKVVVGLAKSKGGINVLADAVAWADGERSERPRQFTIDGEIKKDGNGDVLHFSPAWEKGNMGIRALAFTQGEIPKAGGGGGGGGGPPPPKTPEQSYEATEEALIESLLRAEAGLTDLVAIKDEQGRRLLDRLGLRAAAVYEQLPSRLVKIHARYGNDDPLAEMDDDELPDDDAELEDEGDDDEEEFDDSDDIEDEGVGGPKEGAHEEEE
jgi:hypothetical protein